MKKDDTDFVLLFFDTNRSKRWQLFIQVGFRETDSSIDIFLTTILNYLSPTILINHLGVTLKLARFCLIFLEARALIII